MTKLELIKLYNTPKGKLRAKIKYGGSLMTLKMDQNSKGLFVCSFISMPKYMTSFEVCGISNTETDKSISVRIANENGRLMYDNESIKRIELNQSSYL